MAAEDYLQSDYFDEDDYEMARGGGSRPITCRRCKAYPLTWVHTGVRWALTGKRGALHVCATKPDADGFEPV